MRPKEEIDELSNLQHQLAHQTFRHASLIIARYSKALFVLIHPLFPFHFFPPLPTMQGSCNVLALESWYMGFSMVGLVIALDWRSHLLSLGWHQCYSVMIRIGLP